MENFDVRRRHVYRETRLLGKLADTSVLIYSGSCHANNPSGWQN